MRRTLVLLLIAALTPPPVSADPPPPVVYAHRGGTSLGPENTLGVFRKAHTMFGARGMWLELDAQLSADGQLVVIHDDTLDRTTTCSGPVIEKTAAELESCDAGASFPAWPNFEPVPRLEDVLNEAAAAGWRLMVEIKNIPTERNFEAAGATAAAALADVVEATSFPRDRLVVQAFWPFVLDMVRLTDPTIPVSLLTTSQLPGAPPGVGFYATENAVYSKARGYDMIEPDHTSPDLRPETVAAIQALGLPVVVWTVNDYDAIDRAISLGVDGIISNYPQRVYERIDG